MRRRFWRDNGLSFALLGLFLITWFGQSLAGHRHHNAEQREHGQAEISYGGYLRSPDFLEATAENWESEFFQMTAYVLLTVVLYQRGSSESKDPDETAEVDREPDPKREGAPWPVRRGGIVLALYKRSLAIALTRLFFVSFVMHAIGGAGMYEAEQRAHGHPEPVSVIDYVRTSRFWFESLQNWQSEFLAVLSIVVLSIWLRQYGSPESKPVDASRMETGTE
jgi:hypothetical protein